MLVSVQKDSKESNERCITRFNKLVQASRKLLVLRSRRYHGRKPAKWKVRKAAIMREHYRGLKNKTRFY